MYHLSPQREYAAVDESQRVLYWSFLFYIDYDGGHFFFFFEYFLGTDREGQKVALNVLILKYDNNESVGYLMIEK